MINQAMNQFTASMDASIGAFEAKAQFSRLLRAVQQGERFTITVRGKPVAHVVPHRPGSAQGVADAVAALQAFSRIRGVEDANGASVVIHDPTTARAGLCGSARLTQASSKDSALPIALIKRLAPCTAAWLS
jgi:prevent-host-death family protein